MALFKILRGASTNFTSGTIESNQYDNGADFTPNFHDGYCYFLTDKQEFYIDFVDDEGNYRREPIVHQAIQMIDWEEKEMITFYIEHRNNIIPFSCEKDMTWMDFVNSSYNPIVANSFDDDGRYTPVGRRFAVWEVEEGGSRLYFWDDETLNPREVTDGEGWPGNLSKIEANVTYYA